MGSTHYMLYEETDRKIQKYYLFSEEFTMIKKLKSMTEKRPQDWYSSRLGRSFLLSKIKEIGVLNEEERRGGTLFPGSVHVEKSLVDTVIDDRIPLGIKIRMAKAFDGSGWIWAESLEQFHEIEKKILNKQSELWKIDNPEKAEKWEQQLSEVLEKTYKNRVKNELEKCRVT